MKCTQKIGQKAFGVHFEMAFLGQSVVYLFPVISIHGNIGWCFGIVAEIFLNIKPFIVFRYFCIQIKIETLFDNRLAYVLRSSVVVFPLSPI